MARPARRHARAGPPGHRCPRDPGLSSSASYQRGQGRGTATIQAVTSPGPGRSSVDVGRDGALVVTVALASARALLGLADALSALLSVAAGRGGPERPEPSLYLGTCPSKGAAGPPDHSVITRRPAS